MVKNKSPVSDSDIKTYQGEAHIDGASPIHTTLNVSAKAGIIALTKI